MSTSALKCIEQYAINACVLLYVVLTGKCCFLCELHALIFVSLLVLNLLTGAGAYHIDLYTLSAVCSIRPRALIDYCPHVYSIPHSEP